MENRNRQPEPMSRWGALWDMDGVLVDTEELHFESWAQVISDYNIPFDRASFRKTFGMNNAATVMALWPTTPEPGQIAEVSARKEVIFRQILRGRVQPLPGVLEWLERFQRWGLRQAVASSAPAANIDVMLDELGIRTFFMALAPGDSLPSKPDPAVFLEAARLLELAPDRCIVIEDSVAGVSAAHRAGMRCIAVATTHAPAALHNADLVIERLSALPPEHFLRWLSLD